MRKPLNRKSLISVIEGKGSVERVPMSFHFWTYDGIWGDNERSVQSLKKDYPCDMQIIQLNMPEVLESPLDYPNFRWVNTVDPKNFNNEAIDNRVVINDWSMLDDILAQFPDPDCPHLIPKSPIDDGRYRLGFWWYGLFERFWSFRGMTNAMMDFYIDPESVHLLFRALTDFYKRAIQRGKEELNLDGILFSDDIGTQTGPFFSEEMFITFFKPYYKEIIDEAHKMGMHLWIHSCGNIEKFLPHFIEIGLDVIHPIQKHTMNEKMIAEKYGNDICIWAGFDVQQTIPFGTVDDVRKEVRHLMDTWYRSNGRFMMTCGNGLTTDTPIESLEALLDESYNYGKYIRKKN